MWQITGTRVCRPPGLLLGPDVDGYMGPLTLCVYRYLLSAMEGCSSCRQLGKAHLLGLRQLELPASQEERGEIMGGGGAGESTEREKPSGP